MRAGPPVRKPPTPHQAAIALVERYGPQQAVAQAHRYMLQAGVAGVYWQRVLQLLEKVV